jgi:DNA-binding HxlR family transcriptional regulator
MRNAVFQSQVCSVARALEIIGEWWTLLIVREAFFGTKRFSDFEKNLGVAKNVLSDRLSKLVEAGVMQRSPVTGRGNPQDYTLTDKGRDLFPVVIALMQWGDRWINGPGRAPIRVLERETGEEISQIQVRATGGKALSLRDAIVVPGPGANDAIVRRFGRWQRRRRVNKSLKNSGSLS